MPFAPDSDVVIINDGGPFAAKGALRGGRKRPGKEKVTLEIESEPLVHDFHEMRLGAGPAEAIRDAISEGIKGIAEFASEATQKYRQRAERAFQSGARWATRRYSGGRTGATPPNQTQRLFNDSGRLANGVFVRENTTDTTYTINVPANRFRREEFAAGRFEAMLDRLRDLVPVLGDTRELLEDERVRRAINESINELIEKAPDNMRATLERMKARRNAKIRETLRNLRRLGEVAFGG